MRTIARLRNPIQEYAWGSHTAIAALLDLPVPSEEPQAELWMGAHPKSPSHLLIEGRAQSLIDLVDEFPKEILGEAVAAKFANQLPFLFKVLAAEKPLSIQAHPDRLQARVGFEHENRLNLPLAAASRNYRDANHKPEIICALEPFWALCGFRAIKDILHCLDELHPSRLEREVTRLKARPNQAGLEQFFGTLLSNSDEINRRLVEELLDAVERSSSHRQEAIWMGRLQAHFPGDIGVMSPLLLNLVKLSPGEALYLPAGELHAYLEGVGIELMANSDNVLRGGLTPKHIDVPELLRVLTFESRPLEVLSPVESPSGALHYETPVEEFRLAAISIATERPFTSASRRSVEILLCTEGAALIETEPEEGKLRLAKGDSILIPAAAAQYRLRGNATVYRADVPLREPL